MAVPYTRFSILGTLPGGEVWSVNPAFIGNFDTSPPNQAQLQAWCAAAVQGLGNLFSTTGLGAALSSGGQITGLRASLYGTDGRLNTYGELAGFQITGSGSVKCPPTTAIATSLYSSVAGRSGRGRIYWPALGSPLDGTTGRFTGTHVLAVRNDALAVLRQIQDASPAEWDAVLAVWSSTKTSGLAITRLRVGDIPDSQRRRKDALDEAYSEAPYPLP